MPEELAAALAAVGAVRLWSHQVEGIDAVRQGRDVLVTTPTASGKSLIFQVPVLEEVVRRRPGKALFLYPLKALGQDQRQKVAGLAMAAGVERHESLVAIYDGDTPHRRRSQIRKQPPRILISNPDMLHLGILGSWQAWEPFLRDLRWIVLDELHTYRGVFGSHFHHVLWRLQRICRSLGGQPVMIASSATARNAGEFSSSLAGREFRWIVDSGAPRAGRHFLLFRPSASPYTLTLELLVELLRKGQKTIVFTKARRITELLYSWLEQQAPELAGSVAGYRSGFLPQERRKIEGDLASGTLQGVISTSALELGIDIGGLDACILVGFPGSVMATWQRSGRVGRGGRESLTALVPLPDALDQYFLDHPRELIERPCEQLIVDPGNEQVARSHLVCAAAERPLSPVDDGATLERFAPLVGELLQEGMLRRRAGGEEIVARVARPHGDVNLRGAGRSTAIVEGESGRVIGTVDGVRVLRECHPGAIYLHAGRQYLVRELNLNTQTVTVEAVSVDYYTAPLTQKETEILEVLDRRNDGQLQGFVGRLQITEKVVGFERRKVRGQEAIDRHELDLPPVSYETVGFWWPAVAAIEESLRTHERHFMGALHAAEHATISLIPLQTLCDRGDIGGISIPRHPQLDCGAVFVYDGHPGGVGISSRCFRDLPELLGRVLDLLTNCDCEEGCPSCVHSPKCGNGNRPLDKDGAREFLQLLLDDGDLETEAVKVEIAQAVVEEVADAADDPPPPSEPAPREREARTMLFDLETIHSAAEVGGWQNAHKMRLAVGVVCHLEEGRFETFREEQVDELLAMLDSAETVVGFNILRFDYKVLSGYTGVRYESRWKSIDLLAEIFRRHRIRASLNALASATLGTEKSADGLQSLEWVRLGEWEKVEAYCRRDVEILRDLYLFGRRMGHVVFPDRRRGPRKLSVDW